MSQIAESEKDLERKLCAEVKKLGGWAIKLLSSQITGLPDRLCLLPGGRIFFIEMKSTGKKPTKIQTIVHDKLRYLDFEVFVIDTSEKIDNFIKGVESLAGKDSFQW